MKAALASFPERYFEADSGLDEINMLGKFAPMLVLAVVTLGGGAAVEGSAAAATIAENIGGEAGAIERLAAATEDAGDINKVDNVVNTVKDDTSVVNNTDTGASSAKQGADLRSHLKQSEIYGKKQIKYLNNGKIRYYDKIDPANKPGKMVGRRIVREWDPTSGMKRTWHETLDHDGNIRKIRQELNNGNKTHYFFDEAGKILRELVMKVTIDDINKIFIQVINKEITREDADRWAYQCIQADDLDLFSI